MGSTGDVEDVDEADGMDSLKTELLCKFVGFFGFIGGFLFDDASEEDEGGNTGVSDKSIKSIS